jgi:hypothetical protein
MISELKVIEEKKYQDELTLHVPSDWWFSTYSFSFLNKETNKEHQLKIIPLENKPLRKTSPPKPSYWDITQGDYKVHEDYSSIYQRIESRKKLFLISLYFFLLFGSTIIYFLS